MSEQLQYNNKNPNIFLKNVNNQKVNEVVQSIIQEHLKNENEILQLINAIYGPFKNDEESIKSVGKQSLVQENVKLANMQQQLQQQKMLDDLYSELKFNNKCTCHFKTSINTQNDNIQQNCIQEAQDLDFIKDQSSEEDFLPLKRKNFKKVISSDSSIEQIKPIKRKYTRRVIVKDNDSENEEYVPIKRKYKKRNVIEESSSDGGSSNNFTMNELNRIYLQNQEKVAMRAEQEKTIRKNQRVHFQKLKRLEKLKENQKQNILGERRNWWLEEYIKLIEIMKVLGKQSFQSYDLIQEHIQTRSIQQIKSKLIQIQNRIDQKDYKKRNGKVTLMLGLTLTFEDFERMSVIFDGEELEEAVSVQQQSEIFQKRKYNKKQKSVHSQDLQIVSPFQKMLDEVNVQRVKNQQSKISTYQILVYTGRQMSTDEIRIIVQSVLKNGRDINLIFDKLKKYSRHQINMFILTYLQNQLANVIKLYNDLYEQSDIILDKIWITKNLTISFNDAQTLNQKSILQQPLIQTNKSVPNEDQIFVEIEYQKIKQCLKEFGYRAKRIQKNLNSKWSVFKIKKYMAQLNIELQKKITKCREYMEEKLNVTDNLVIPVDEAEEILAILQKKQNINYDAYHDLKGKTRQSQTIFEVKQIDAQDDQSVSQSVSSLS